MKFNEILNISEKIISNVEKQHKIPAKIDNLTPGEYGSILIKSVLNPGKEMPKNKYDNAPGPNGETISKTLTRKEYTDMANHLYKFISKMGRLPNYVSYQNKKVNINLIIYCFAKIIRFYGKNKRLPNTCDFHSSVFNNKSSAKYTTKGGTVCKKLVNICKMSINNYKDVYKAMSKFTYQYYYNDVKKPEKTLQDKAGNCTDLNQIERAALKELGYDVQIVRGLVKCNDGNTYGHVWCRIKVSGKWTNIDASAAAKGKSLGSVICAKVVEITNINPSWAVSDDGRT